jgi:hypothetical protein
MQKPDALDEARAAPGSRLQFCGIMAQTPQEK